MLDEHKLPKTTHIFLKDINILVQTANHENKCSYSYNVHALEETGLEFYKKTIHRFASIWTHKIL